MTPINEHRTRYFWFQMRNFAPGDEEVSRRLDASVRAAFEEDRVILEAVHRGIANERAPHINLPIDAGPLRFRRRVAEMIEAERAGLGSAVTAAAPAHGCAEGEALHVH
jgi:vanillate O-demethylase monooxygenase subunit